MNQELLEKSGLIRLCLGDYQGDVQLLAEVIISARHNDSEYPWRVFAEADGVQFFDVIRSLDRISDAMEQALERR